LAVTASRGTLQKPTYKSEPNAIEPIPGEYEVNASEDEKKADNPADVGGYSGSTLQFATPPPYQGPEHASTIQWKSGNKVENTKSQINISQPVRYGCDELD
jgi:hypothetical protein